MTMQWTNSFDKVAPFYDVLSRMIYFNAQRNAQINQLHYLQPGSVILIVGGGSGWILESIAAHYSSGLQIVYVEMSERMMRYSQRRNAGENLVTFVLADITDYSSDLKFDAILTPFLFDNFSTQTADRVFMQINTLLKPQGLWLTADFSLEKPNGQWWKLLMTKAMYTFFKAFGIVEGNKLINIDSLFSQHQYRLKDKQFYYRGFIKGCVYCKK